MSEPGGGLRAVPDPKSPAEQSAETLLAHSQGTPTDDRGSSWPIGLIIAGLVLGLVATGIGWASAHQRGAELDAKLQAATSHLEAARSELQATRGALEARRAHMDEVREGVGALTVELEALNQLLATDPESPPTP